MSSGLLCSIDHEIYGWLHVNLNTLTQTMKKEGCLYKSAPNSIILGEMRACSCIFFMCSLRSGDGVVNLLFTHTF